MSSECNQNNTAVPRANENGERWQQARLSVETTYADAPVVLRVNGVRAGTLGNFSASIGKAKSKKSFNVSAMAAAALCGDYVLAYEVVLPADRQTVLYVDTEQSRTDCQNQMRRILRLAGQSPDTDNPRLVFLSLRQFTPEERIAIIDAAMGSLPNIGLVIIDGVRDLLHDINNPTEATTVISLLMKWTDLYQFHIHTVLHQNKSDENARGHLGTELANKAETVMLVEKDKNDADISVVRPAYTRAAEFPPFAFRIVSDSIAVPEIVGSYSVDEQKTGRQAVGKFDAYSSITEAQHRQALDIIFADQSKEYGYSDFRQAVKSAYGQILRRTVGGNHVSGIIQCLRNKRIVTQEGDRKGKPYRFNPDFVW